MLGLRTGKELSLKENQSESNVTRREFLAALPSLALLLSPKRGNAQALQTFNGPMADMNAVYRPVALPAKPNAKASMTDAQRDDLEHQIHCQCGCNLDVYTCRTTDFSCTVSPAMHADVMGLVAGGYGAKEILAAFKSVYGEKVLMAPIKSGLFNLFGYSMPFVALAAGAVLVSALLKRWKTREAALPAPPIAATVNASREELDALDAAVRRDA